MPGTKYICKLQTPATTFSHWMLSETRLEHRVEQKTQSFCLFLLLFLLAGVEDADLC